MKRLLLVGACILLSSVHAFAAYGYQATITLGNSSQIPASQTNFTVMVCANLTLGNSNTCQSITGLKGTGSGGYVTSANGYDIIFSTTTCSSPTTMNFQMPLYTSSSGAMEAWVMVTSLAASGTFYMCVGNSGISTFQGGPGSSSFASSYQGVWHLPNGSTLSVSDSLGYNSSANHNATAVTGQIDGGAGMTSTSSQYIDTAWNSTMGSNYSISCWAAPNSSVSGNAKIISNGYYGANQEMTIYAHNTGASTWQAEGDAGSGGGSNNLTASTTYSFSTWHMISLTYNSSSLILYVDGSSAASASLTGSIGSPSYSFQIGRMPYFNQQYFDGSIDECRLASTAWSANWIKTEYNNQNAPSSFMTIGSLSPLSTAYTATAFDLISILDKAAGIGAHYPATYDRGSGIVDSAGGFAAHIASTTSCSSPNCPAPLLVNSAFAYGNTSNTLTVSLSPTPGDTVIVSVTAMGSATAPTITSVTDNFGYPLTADANLAPSGLNPWRRGHFRYVAPKGVTSFTTVISQSSPSYYEISAVELQGPVVLDAYDTTGNQGTVIHLGTATTSSFTTTNTQDLVLIDSALTSFPVVLLPLPPWTMYANHLDTVQVISESIGYYYTSAAGSVQGKALNNGAFSAPFLMSGLAYYSPVNYLPGETFNVQDFISSMARHFSVPYETVPVSDSATEFSQHYMSVRDNVPVSDYTARKLSGFRSSTDATSISDLVTTLGSHFASPFELSPTSDYASSYSAHFASTMDRVSVADYVSRVLSINRSTFDSLFTLDKIASLGSHFTSQFESTPVSDQVSRQSNHFISTSDLSPVYDFVSALKLKLVMVTDSLMVMDIVSRVAALHTSTADNAPVVESGRVTAGRLRTTFDIAPVWERAGMGMGVSPREMLPTVDSATRLASLHIINPEKLSTLDIPNSYGAHFTQTVDSLKVFDSILGHASHFASPSDSLVIFDLGSAHGVHFVSNYERLSIYDFATTGNRIVYVTVNESNVIYDIVTRTLGLHISSTESIPVSDLSYSHAAHFSSPFDTLSTIDYASKSAGLHISTTDLTSIYDLGSYGNRVLFANVFDLSSSFDISSRIQNLHTNTFDLTKPTSASASDIPFTQSGFHKSTVDTTLIADAAAEKANHFRNVIESNRIIDLILQGQHSFTVTASEFAALRENPSIVVVVRPPVVDNGALAIYPVQIYFATYPVGALIAPYPASVTFVVLK